MSEFARNPEANNGVESVESLLVSGETSWHAVRGIDLAAIDCILSRGIEPKHRADGKVCVCVRFAEFASI